MGKGRKAKVSKSNSIRKEEDDRNRLSQKVTPSTQSSNNNSNGANGQKTTIDNFRAMSVNDASDFLDSIEKDPEIIQTILSNNLNDSNFYQQVLLSMGLNDKPLVLSDKDFDKAFKTESATPLLYRGLDDADFVDQTKQGDFSWASGGYHGAGVAYLSTDIGTAQMYGYGKNYQGRDEGFTAFLDKSKIKSVTEYDLSAMWDNESSKVQKSFTGNSGFAAYALFKGYNCIKIPGGNDASPRGPSANGRGSTARSAQEGNRYAYKNVNGAVSGEDYYVPLVRNIMVIREHARRR